MNSNTVAADHGWEQSLSTRGGGEGYDGSEFQGTSRKVSFWPLFKHHLRDWVIIVIMAILEIIDYVLVPPYHRFVSEHNINYFTFPSNKYTVPTWSVLVIAVIIPLLIFFLYFLRRRSILDFHNAFLGLATAITLTALLTDAIKNVVGMPRPNFFHTCFPDGIPQYSADVDRRVICHPNSKSEYEDGYKSFPSGHASWCFAGLGYLSMYLAGKMGLFDKRGYSSRVFIVAMPLLLAALVSISRVDDYQHRWVDIIFAALLGAAVGYFCYRTFYPSVYSEWAGLPHEYPPQPIFAHGQHPTSMPPAMQNGTNDVERGRM
jgi:diacylglycerol diphosphate phosphatase/phosphatidate phosphatase